MAPLQAVPADERFVNRVLRLPNHRSHFRNSCHPPLRLTDESRAGRPLPRERPALANWLEENIAEAWTIFAFPAAHRKRLRTNNGLEQPNKEITRRTCVAAMFPNEASLLRLVLAFLSEFSDDWGN